MSSEHVEVLRDIRNWMASVYWDSLVDALDAAIAALSAPQPPAEAQAQVGGEVAYFRKEMIARCREYAAGMVDIGADHHDLEAALAPLLGTAPPSAPVGVEVGPAATDRDLLKMAASATGLEWREDIESDRAEKGILGLWIVRPDGKLVNTAWNPLHNSSDAFHLAVEHGISVCLKGDAAATRRAIVNAVIAQQPAPIKSKWLDDLHDLMDVLAALPQDEVLVTANSAYNVGYQDWTGKRIYEAAAALAQQPAAVDGVVERVHLGPFRLWQADLVGGQISVERMREILTAALAGQQGGES